MYYKNLQSNKAHNHNTHNANHQQGLYTPIDTPPPTPSPNHTQKSQNTAFLNDQIEKSRRDLMLARLEATRYSNLQATTSHTAPTINHNNLISVSNPPTVSTNNHTTEKPNTHNRNITPPQNTQNTDRKSPNTTQEQTENDVDKFLEEVIVQIVRNDLEHLNLRNE